MKQFWKHVGLFDRFMRQANLWEMNGLRLPEPLNISKWTLRTMLKGPMTFPLKSITSGENLGLEKTEERRGLWTTSWARPALCGFVEREGLWVHCGIDAPVISRLDWLDSLRMEWWKGVCRDVFFSSDVFFSGNPGIPVKSGTQNSRRTRLQDLFKRQYLTEWCLKKVWWLGCYMRPAGNKFTHGTL